VSYVIQVNLKYYGCLVPALDDTSNKFLLTHVEYLNPEIVLQNDNIAIFGCDQKYVWFGVAPKEVRLPIIENLLLQCAIRVAY